MEENSLHFFVPTETVFALYRPPYYKSCMSNSTTASITYSKYGKLFLQRCVRVVWIYAYSKIEVFSET